MSYLTKSTCDSFFPQPIEMYYLSPILRNVLDFKIYIIPMVGREYLLVDITFVVQSFCYIIQLLELYQPKICSVNYYFCMLWKILPIKEILRSPLNLKFISSEHKSLLEINI